MTNSNKNEPPSDVTGFILAGGRSLRMGKDKAQIAWGSGTFLTHAVERMQRIAGKVCVVGAVADAAVRVVPDVFAGCGPLAGIHAALAHSETDWNLVLAVDMPLVTPPLLEFIARQSDLASAAVLCEGRDTTEVWPAPGSYLQPLCAAYHRRLLPYLELALSKRELSIHRLLERLRAGMMKQDASAVLIVDEQQLASAGFSNEMLLNVNTPADLERARLLRKEWAL